MKKTDRQRATVQDFAAAFKAFAESRSLSPEEIFFSDKPRARKGLGPEVARMLTDRLLLTPGGASWTNQNVSKWFAAWKNDGSLLVAIRAEPTRVSEEPNGSAKMPELTEAMPTAPEGDSIDTVDLSEEDSIGSFLTETTVVNLEALEIPGISSISDAADASDVACPSELLPACDETESPDDGRLPEAWRIQVIEIVQKELEKMTTLLQSVQNQQNQQKTLVELAPTPDGRIRGGKGKPVNPGKRVKIAGTLDAELERRIRQWCRERRVTLSHGLDTALWSFFDKPKLSFEL